MTVNEASALLKQQDNILIITHKNPDGDTLGCGYALWGALTRLGRRVKVVNSDDIPHKYSYLYSVHDKTAVDFKPEFVIAVDIATPDLVGKPYQELCRNADLCIDHHGTNTMYAKKTVVDAESASCCEIMTRVIDELGVKLDDYIASALYTGLITDTGCFRQRNTTVDSHLLAARLMNTGIDWQELNRIHFEQKSKSRLMLEQLAVANMDFTLDNRVAIITITQDMMKLTGAVPGDVEGITPIARSIEGVEVGVTLRQLESGNWKCSLRTHNVDAAAICAQFGGGGHFGAAGFECSGEPDDIKTMLVNAIKEVLK